jgi:molecular chaperone HscC
MIVGIDLGTTNSLIGVWRNGRSELIPNALGEVLTPSVVGVDDNGDILVGRAAQERLVSHPHLTVGAFKRFMGSERMTSLGLHRFRAEELSAMVLRSLKSDAEASLGEPVTDAIITVPAYFNDCQRKATRLAGELAGLRVERLLNEPTAAGLAYGLHEALPTSRFMVLDLGGGTFDVSVLEWFEGVMEVRASAGDNYLGGEDFVDLIVAAFMRESALEASDLRVDIPKYQQLNSCVRHAAMRLLHKLSSENSAGFEINWEGQKFVWSLDNAGFEKIATPLLDRLRAPIERALRDARLNLREIDSLLMVGGATRMTIVRQAVTRLFGRFPTQSINPDEAIACGAAVQAGLKARDAALEDVVLTDVCPYSLGTQITRVLGSGRFEPDIFSPIIERNTLIPASRVTTFTTVTDYQTEVRFLVYQGESRHVKNNVFLGEIKVAVPPKPAGDVSIAVRFTYDIDGLLEVDVDIPETGVHRNLVIEGRTRHYSPEDLAERRAYLANLKVHPRDQTENRTLLATAERLYEQCLGEAREYVQQAIDIFVAALQTQNPHHIERERQIFAQRIAQLEGSSLP